MKCSGIKQMDKQPFPKKGILFKNLDLNLEQVLKKLGTEQKPEIYAYILSTVSFSKEQDQFVQNGSAPNFQGDYITLCTCKHYMRSCRPANQTHLIRSAATFSPSDAEKEFILWDDFPA